MNRPNDISGLPTKWDRISDQERVHLQRMKFTNSYGDPGKCSGCGKELPTEADFAMHFVIPDTRYLNLGYCPNPSDWDAETERGV